MKIIGKPIFSKLSNFLTPVLLDILPHPAGLPAPPEKCLGVSGLLQCHAIEATNSAGCSDILKWGPKIFKNHESSKIKNFETFQIFNLGDPGHPAAPCEPLGAPWVPQGLAGVPQGLAECPESQGLKIWIFQIFDFR